MPTKKTPLKDKEPVKKEPVMVQPGSRKLTFWIIAIVIIFGLIWLLSEVLAPFVTGMVIAYLLNPVVSWFDKKAPRGISAIAVLVAFALVFASVFIIISPLIGRQAVAFFNDVPTYIDEFRLWSKPYMNQFMQHLSQDDVEKIQEAAGEHVGTVVKGTRDVILRIWSSGLAVLDLVTFLAITPVVAFYCLRDWPALVAKVDELLPRHSRKTLRQMFREFDQRLAGFMRGQLLVCLCLGTMYALALTIVGLKFGLAIGFIAGILSFIPYVGSVFGFVASVGVALVQYPSWEMPTVVVTIFFIGQFIEGNFLTPKLVGERIGLHPVWVIFALMSGGQLMGFTGLLLAVPVAAMVGVVMRHAIIWYEKSPAYLGK